MRRVLMVVAALLSGCASQQSVKVLGPEGLRGNGSIAMTGTMSDGRFTVSDRGMTCSGKFLSWSNLTVTFPVKCTDGSSGTVSLTRPFQGPLSATGTMILNNGQTKQIAYGRAAGQ